MESTRDQIRDGLIASDLGLLRPADLARELKISLPSVYNAIKGMPHAKIGRSLVVRRSDFDKWLATRLIGPAGR